MRPLRREAVPHLVTASRLVVVAAAYVAAYFRSATLVVALALLAVATDVVDGILARRWGVTSTFGANLDSAIDFVFYASLVAWAWWFEPAAIGALAPWVALYLALYVGVLAVAKARRGAMGLHNAWTRTAATVGVTLALWTILFGWEDAFLWVLLLTLTADLGQRLARILRAPRTTPGGPDPAER